MKTLKDFDFNDKRTIVRCDFNVPIKDKKVADNFRIKEILPTINYLIEEKAKIILISHLNSPKGKDKRYSLKIIAKELKELLGKEVKFLNDCKGKEVENQVNKLKQGEVVLLENLRFYPEEEKNDISFAKSLAKLGDIYISEAFGVCHRKHASIDTLPRLIPSGIGFLFGREITSLSRIRENPDRPFVVIIGGAKISSKLKMVEKFLPKADYILLGGKIANVILTVKGICLSRAWPEEDIVKIVEKIELTDSKIYLPVDVLVSPHEKTGEYIRETGPALVRKEEGIFDIGPETIEIFEKIIKQAKTIIWAGALGLAENEKFSKGTKAIAKAISRNYDAFSIAGGGDTMKFLNQFALADSFSYTSTGGGAMLNYLAKQEMPGIEALK
jgi:phosphoglycerate kinase